MNGPTADILKFIDLKFIEKLIQDKFEDDRQGFIQNRIAYVDKFIAYLTVHDFKNRNDEIITYTQQQNCKFLATLRESELKISSNENNMSWFGIPRKMCYDVKES